MQRPNILYFVCQDIGKHLECYGVPVETPNLDRFARQGVRFERGYCNSPACSPSRICTMTGQYAHTSGGVGLAHMGWPLDSQVRTIIDEFNDAGYETILSGMQHERHPRSNCYQADLAETWEDWDTDRAVDMAVGYLQKRNRSRPFYLNIGSQSPHASWWHKAETKYGGVVPPQWVWVPPWCPDHDLTRSLLGQFQAAIRFVDYHFGRLMAALERLGHDRDTMVIFTTDHGIAAPRSKGTLYDRGVEIALLVRLPQGHRAGTRVEHLIQNIDFVPTLLEATGLPPLSRLAGRSFWPALRGEEYQPHEMIFMERNFHGEKATPEAKEYSDVYDPIRAVRTPEYHYIRWFNPQLRGREMLPWEIPAGWRPTGDGVEHICPSQGGPRLEEELYDVRHDPLEIVNVAGRPEYAGVKTRLRRELQGWMERTGDFVLTGQVPKRPQEPGWGPNWPVKT